MDALADAGQVPCQLEVLLPLDAAPYLDDALGLLQVHRLARLLKRRLGPLSNR